MIRRYCVCGVPIPASKCLCFGCTGLYTLDRKKWPEWLSTWMRSYQAELNDERNHPCESIEELAEREDQICDGDNY